MRLANKNVRITPKFSFQDTAIAELYAKSGRDAETIAEIVAGYVKYPMLRI